MPAERLVAMSAAVCGLAFVGLSGLGFVVSVIVPWQPYPSPFGSVDSITTYFEANRDEERIVSALQVLASISLLVFSALVIGLIEQNSSSSNTRQTGALRAVALAGGITSSAMLLVCALSAWVLSREYAVAEPTTLRAVHDLVYLTGGPGHVAVLALFIGPVSLVVRRRGSASVWLRRLGLFAAGASLLSVAALIAEPAAYILPLARGLTFLWIFLLCLVLITRPAKWLTGEQRTAGVG